MTKIKYEIKESLPNIFVVIVPSHYIRAMLFLRVQEFYESKNIKFRGKKFSFWDYKEWYSSIKGGKFTYTDDWGGFNVPFETAVKCMSISKIETPYDREMKKILKLVGKNKAKGKCYLIGVERLKSDTFKHEMAHAMYHTNKEYRRKMDSITKLIKKKPFTKIKQQLKKDGYCDKVIMDEIQAYLSTDRNSTLLRITKVNKKVIKEYKSEFKKYYENIKKTLEKD